MIWIDYLIVIVTFLKNISCQKSKKLLLQIVMMLEAYFSWTFPVDFAGEEGLVWGVGINGIK